MCVWSSFLKKFFLKRSKMKIFVLNFSKRAYVKAFSVIASSMKMLSTNLRVEHVNIYVYIFVYVFIYIYTYGLMVYISQKVAAYGQFVLVLSKN